MERWTAKLLALIGTFVLPFLCTVLPYKVSGYITRKGATGKRTLSYLMCLGGGIFFGTYLLHMGPEVQTILRRSLLEPNNITYPLAELIVGIGFFIVLFAEKIVLRWNEKRISRKRRRSCRLHSVDASRRDTLDEKVVRKEEQNTLVAGSRHEIRCANPDDICPECLAGKPCSGFDEGEMMNEKRNQHIDSQVANKVLMTTDSLSATVVDIEDLASCANALAGSSCRMAGTGECCNDPPQTSKDWSQKEKHIVITMKVDNKPVEQDVASSIGDVDAHTHGGHHHATRSIILILALSLHRIFEGMSIGLQTNLTSVASLFGAVMCHETVIGFSLGLQFVKSDFGLRRLLITSFVCSSIMPVGVLIGLIMTETGSDASSIEIANGVLQAIAMGTFIYVTFFEILQEEVNPEDTSICKIVCIAAGFVMMALLDLIPEEQTTDALLSTHVTMINLTTAGQTIFT